MDSGLEQMSTDLPKTHASSGTSAAQTVGATEDADATGAETAMDGGVHATGDAATGPATGAAPVVQPVGGPDGSLTDLRRRYPGVVDAEIMSDDLARLYLAQACTFLSQVAAITSAVVESINVGQLRRIVAAEVDVPRDVILEDGVMVTAPLPAPDRDHRKLPRGRKHPLMLLLQCGLQSVRMLRQITSELNPNAHNAETLEQKQARAADKERERTFSNLLKGRV